MWLCVLAAGCFGNVNITRKKVDKKGRTDFSENVLEGVYLLRLLKSKRNKNCNIEVVEKETLSDVGVERHAELG
jgi:hypothetical protein